ncbi:MAG: ATP-binding protein [bacterium]|uniref:sensor histidine kinase n=1 Tax=Phaeodactylibacter xiamenensis TaxID=1524460 RepID=UPI0021D1271B|nr:ATP-binding protein [Phaeodactylibacter xiamenensis]MCR9053757.1 ATP-binding protein [bacterium]
MSRHLPNPKAQAREYLQIIQSNAKRMNTLIEDLLEYSRVANIDHLKERVDLHAVLEEVRTLIREGEPTGGAIVETEKLPVITGNKTQLFLLFKNLISNGLKYNSAPDPEVQLSYEKSSCWHILKFADNGIGIEPQYQQKVFEMFTRLHDRSKYEGSGLGLAICRNIVHRHNGTIELESQIGNGSVFTVKLPVVGEEG